MRRRLSILIPVLFAAPAAVLAQGTASRATSPCPYQACALRVQWGVFSTKVVRGELAEPVGRIGLFSGAIPPLESAPEPVAREYRAFRGRYATSTLCNLLGVAAMFGAYATVYNDPWGGGGRGGEALLLGSLALVFVGSIERTSAMDHLEQAIWHYNGTLMPAAAPVAPAPPPPPPPLP